MGEGNKCVQHKTECGGKLFASDSWGTSGVDHVERLAAARIARQDLFWLP